MLELTLAGRSSQLVSGISSLMCSPGPPPVVSKHLFRESKKCRRAGPNLVSAAISIVISKCLQYRDFSSSVHWRWEVGQTPEEFVSGQSQKTLWCKLSSQTRMENRKVEAFFSRLVFFKKSLSLTRINGLISSADFRRWSLSCK